MPAITCHLLRDIPYENGRIFPGDVTESSETFVTHGNFASGPVALCLTGLGLTALLVARRVPGAIGLGLIAAAPLALTAGHPRRMTPLGYLVAGVFSLEFFQFRPLRP